MLNTHTEASWPEHRRCIFTSPRRFPLWGLFHELAYSARPMRVRDDSRSANDSLWNWLHFMYNSLLLSAHIIFPGSMHCIWISGRSPRNGTPANRSANDQNAIYNIAKSYLVWLSLINERRLSTRHIECTCFCRISYNRVVSVFSLNPYLKHGQKEWKILHIVLRDIAFSTHARDISP